MTDDYAVPRDVWTERTFVGGLLAAGKIPEGIAVTPELVWEPALRPVLTACATLAAKGHPYDPISVRVELLRAGARGQATDAVWLADLFRDGCMPAQLSHHARSLRDLHVRRQVIESAQRALQSASNPSSDPFDVAAALHVHAGNIADSGDPIRLPAVVDGEDFVNGPIEFDWLVPGLLERGDRLLVTGGEGSGKSVLTRQIGLTVAAGIHPFTGRPIEPCRVTIVDLENGSRHLRRHMRSMWQLASTTGRPISRGMLSVESRPSGMDLTRGDDPTWLARYCEATRPDLLVIGPLYRMHNEDMNKEEPARALTRVIDSIRAAHNCAVVMETHSPHAQSGASRSLRPVGSSLFLRWPEFGYGLRPKDDEEALMHLGSWRGPRDERDFPRMLARGTEGEWPWQTYTGLVRPHEGWAS